MPFTPGRHTVKIAGTTLSTTSTGKEQIVIRFQNQAGDYISAYRYFSDRALEYTAKDLKALGWDPDQNGWEIDRLHESDVLLGAPAEIVVTTETYNGSETLKVKFINAPGGGGGLPGAMSTEEARGFASMLRSRLGVSAAPAAPSPATGEEFEVPF